MIVPMKKVLLVALREDQEALAEALQRCGEVMPIPPEDNPPDTGPEDTSALRAEQALKVIRKYQGKQSMFAPRPEVTEQRLLSPSEEGMALLGQVEDLQGRLDRVRADKDALQARMAELAPWLPMDIPVEALSGTRHAGIYSGYGERARAEEIKAAVEKAGAAVELLDTGPQGTAMLLYVYREEGQELFQALSALGFSQASPPQGKGLPKEMYREAEAQAKALDAQEEKLIKDLTGLAARKEELELLWDQAETAGEREKVPFSQTVQTVFLEGWVRSDRVEKVKKAVAKITDCYEIIVSDPEEGENPPTATKNSWFITQFETITDMFSRPHKGELDPNPVMGPWYWIIFGLMMADAGYGLLMLIGLGLFKKLKKPKGEFGKLVNVLFFSSFTTMAWGVVFGSYFGATWHPLIFRTTETNPGGILYNPMQMLIFCLGIGLLHMFSGMIMKWVADAKAGHFWDGVFDQLSWILLLSGLGLLAVGFLGITVPEPVRKAAMVMAIVGAAIILFTAGRAKKGIFGKIIGGFGGLYGITSYMGDILSYARILALALAGGVVGMVMNLLAGLVQGSVLGFICSLLIYAVGHVFNLAMSLLSAYVHDSRLQYIEFFNKFYEGGGYAFRPLQMNPRFVDITADGENQGGN